MSSSKGGYYLPEPSHWPIIGSVGMFLMLFGFASFLHGSSSIVMIIGAAIIINNALPVLIALISHTRQA